MLCFGAFVQYVLVHCACMYVCVAYAVRYIDMLHVLMYSACGVHVCVLMYSAVGCTLAVVFSYTGQFYRACSGYTKRRCALCEETIAESNKC